MRDRPEADPREVELILSAVEERLAAGYAEQERRTRGLRPSRPASYAGADDRQGERVDRFGLEGGGPHTPLGAGGREATDLGARPSRVIGPPRSAALVQRLWPDAEFHNYRAPSGPLPMMRTLAPPGE